MIVKFDRGERRVLRAKARKKGREGGGGGGGAPRELWISPFTGNEVYLRGSPIKVKSGRRRYYGLALDQHNRREEVARLKLKEIGAESCEDTFTDLRRECPSWAGIGHRYVIEQANDMHFDELRVVCDTTNVSHFVEMVDLVGRQPADFNIFVYQQVARV